MAHKNTETECQKAIEYVSQNISIKYPQYPQIGDRFKTHCHEEAYDAMDVLTDDFEQGFDESIILESITESYNITEHDKQSLCKTIHHLLSKFNTLSAKPTSLNLNSINTAYTSKQVHSIRKLFLSKIKSFVANNTDLSIFKVLAIGQNNNFPLLIYLVDMFHRWRLKMYLQKGLADVSHHVTVDDFFPDKKNESNEDMSGLYKQAIKACVHRNGICPLLQLNITYKIPDSVQTYTNYCNVILKSIDDMVERSLINFPTQIDICIIPKHTAESKTNDSNDESEDHSSDEFVKQSDDINKRLENTDNLRTMNVMPKDLNKLAQRLLFQQMMKKVLGGHHKRMVMIIDRMINSNDVVHAYLPKNSQNISNGDFVPESMINLTKLELVPSKTGEINEDTINSHSDFYNSCMFTLSLHICRKNEIRMYWYFNGSCSRFHVKDMFNLWPLYFRDIKLSKVADCDVNSGLKAKLKFDVNNLIDSNFTDFYELNAGNKCAPKKKSIVYVSPVDVNEVTNEMSGDDTMSIINYNNEFKSDHIVEDTRNTEILFDLSKSEFWDICPTKSKYCIQRNGTVIHRLPHQFNVGLQNKVYEQFMFGCSKAINYEKTEFKVQYRSLSAEYCQDAIGITTKIDECESIGRWITNINYEQMVHGTRYVYWGGGIIWEIIQSGDSYDKIKHSVGCKWKDGQIVTIQVIKGILKFFVNGTQIGNEIKMISEGKNGTKAVYYPIISTQCDDARFTLL